MRKALISQGFSVRHLNRPQHLVGEGGFEPPKSVTTDFQSAPFGHSGIPPHKARVTIPRLLGLVKRPPAIFPPKNPRYSPATRPALFFYTRYFKTGCFLVYYTRPGSGHKKRGLPICADFAGLQARSPGGKRSSGRWPIGSPTAGRIPKDTIWMGPSPWPSAA